MLLTTQTALDVADTLQHILDQDPLAVLVRPSSRPTFQAAIASIRRRAEKGQFLADGIGADEPVGFEVL